MKTQTFVATLLIILSFLNAGDVRANGDSRGICDKAFDFINSNTGMGFDKFLALNLENSDQLDPLTMSKLKNHFEMLSVNPDQMTVAECKKHLSDFRFSMRSEKNLKQKNRTAEIEGVVFTTMSPPRMKHEISDNDTSKLACGEETKYVYKCDPETPAFSQESLGIPSSIVPLVKFEDAKNQKRERWFSDEDCRCFNEKMKSSKRNLVNGPAADLLKPSVDSQIRKEAGQKVLSKFALLLEDTGYYLNNKAFVVNGDDVHKKASLLCTESNDFLKKIDQACEKNGTTSDKEKRLSEVMSSFGDKYDAKNFSKDFQSFVTDVNTITVVQDENGKKVPARSMHRREFDQARNSFAKESWRTDFVSESMVILASDPGFDQLLKSEYKKGVSNSDILIKAYSSEYVGTLSKATSEKLNQKKRDHHDLAGPLQIHHLKEKLKATIDIALKTEPSLRSVMSDFHLLTSAQYMINDENRNQGIIEILEREKGLFNSELAARCSTIQNELAEAVCAKNPSQEIEPRKLAQILKGSLKEDKSNREAYVSLICENVDNKTAKSSLWNNLRETDDDFKSDYYDKKMNFENQTNPAAIALMKISSNAKLKEEVSGLINATSSQRVVLDRPGAVKNIDPSFVSLAAPAIEKVATPTSVVQKAVAQTTAQPEAPMAAPQSQPLAFPQFAPAVTHVQPTVTAPTVTAPSRSIASVANTNVSSANQTKAAAKVIEEEDEDDSEYESEYKEKVKSPRITKKESKEVEEFKTDLNKISSNDELEKLKNQFSFDTKAMNSKMDDLKSRLAFYENGGRFVSGVTGGIAGGTMGTLGGGQGLPELDRKLDERAEAIIAGAIKEAGAGASASGGAPQVSSLTVTLAGNVLKSKTDPSISEDVIKYLSKLDPSMQLLGDIQSQDFKFLYTVEELTQSGQKVQKQIEIRFKDLSKSAQAHIQNLFKLRLVESRSRVVELKTLLTLSKMHRPTP